MICNNFDGLGYDVILAGKIVVGLAIGRILKKKLYIGTKFKANPKALISKLNSSRVKKLMV